MILSLSFVVRVDVFSATFAISNLKSRKRVDKDKRESCHIEAKYEEHFS